MESELIVVNSKDEIIGTETKESCHVNDGILHRAITIFIFNHKNEILLTKRSKNKKLWPDYWDTSCSTHVRQGETYEQAGERRLGEELGFTCKLKFIFKFQYQATFQNIGSENEICALLIGKYSGNIDPNSDEISAHKWIGVEQLKNEISDRNNSPWLKIAFNEYLKYSKPS